MMKEMLKTTRLLKASPSVPLKNYAHEYDWYKALSIVPKYFIGKFGFYCLIVRFDIAQNCLYMWTPTQVM
jgi:hypothetical protein